MKTKPRTLIISSLVSFIAVLTAGAVCLAQPRLAPPAQPPTVPPPVGVQSVVPLAVCPGSTQAGTCDDLAWVRAQRTAALATPPAPTAETPEARRARQTQCVATTCGGESGDTICTCICRSAYFNVATRSCTSIGDSVDALAAGHENHEARIAALEARAGITGATVAAAAVPSRSHVRRARRRR